MKADADRQHGRQWVMCLRGAEYCSVLVYQPSIAFEATGLLVPPSTLTDAQIEARPACIAWRLR